MRKSFTRGAVAIIAGAALFGALPATAAHAGSFTCKSVSTTGAEACFRADGDIMYVWDTKADGHSATAQWQTDYGRTGICKNTNGSGDANVKVCNYDMRENSQIGFRALRTEGSTVVNASGWVYTGT